MNKRNGAGAVTKAGDETHRCGNFLCRRVLKFDAYGRGRPQKYCDDSCKMQAYRDRKRQVWREANRRPAGTQWDCTWCNTRTYTGEEHTGGVRCGVCGARMSTQAKLIP